ncbi:MAG: hypothetical protein ACLF0P_13480 [Thermoanaerobaculia bacterium]
MRSENPATGPNPGDRPEIVCRVARFLEDPAAEAFDLLARDAWAFQVERIPAHRGLARAREVDPRRVRSWRGVPPVPALAYKSVAVALPEAEAGAAGPAVETFRSSGTTGGPRSVHRHPFPGLYRAVIDASFPHFCLRDAAGRGFPGRPPALSLVPPRATLPDSSLSFMVEHVVDRWSDPEASAWAFAAGPGQEGLDEATAEGWARARQRDGRPGLVLATAFALSAWLDRLEEAGERLRLPAGTTLFETGGFKGRGRELTRQELLRRVEERLGVPPERVVREYGMTELTSQLYTDVLAGGDPDLFVAPHWVRVRVLDPETLEEAPPGTPGLIAIFDLANLSSAVHVLTEDLGATEPEGLRLLGRAAGAELRGCSLAAEELTGR